MIGAECIVMEGAVLRGAPTFPLTLGDHVLVGPRAYLSGCTVEESVFLAAGSTVFNGARIGAGSEVRINGVVHIKTTLPPDTTVPIGWVAVGDPPRILPPDRHDGDLGRAGSPSLPPNSVRPRAPGRGRVPHAGADTPLCGRPRTAPG